MFDLERTIETWRQQMTDAGINAPVPLDELESHLRDAVDEQMRLGLSEERAFEAASRQIGHAGELRSEFEKVSTSDLPWGQKFGDRYAAWGFACFHGFYVIVVTCLLLRFAFFSGHERAMGFAALAATLLAVFAAWQLIPRVLPMIGNKRIESAIVSACVVSGGIWFVFFVRFVLPRFEFTPGGLRVAILWAMIPTMVTVTPTFFFWGRKSEHPENSAIAS